jgi:uncharacterized protein (DUF302 family)
MRTNTAPGLVNQRSPFSVDETRARIERLLESKKITVFARIDHAAEARKAGLDMPPTQVLIFGNPRQGTPLMQVSPLIAIDLPLKALIWEDKDGQVWVAHNAPEYLQERYAVSSAVLKNISGLGGLINEALTQSPAQLATRA